MKKLLIALAVIAVLAGGGALAYKQVNKKQSVNTQATQNSSQQQSQNEASKSDPSEGGKYLVIKEWGVRLPLTDDIRDINYSFAKPTDQFATLSTANLKQLSKQYPECAQADGSISINRAKPGYDHFGSPWTDDELSKIGKKVGDYYYYPDAGQPCFPAPNSETYKTPDEIGKIRASLSNAIESIKSI